MTNAISSWNPFGTARILQYHKERVLLAGLKGSWRIFHNYAPNAKAVYILGVQRSGTTLLLKCLNRSMEVEAMGEVSKAMVNFRIIADDALRKLIASSHHKAIVFKPLTDSHRARDLLSLTPNGLAIWMYRRVGDRANSAVAMSGDHNLQILRDFSKGKDLDIWQAKGLTDENLRLIRSFDYSEMSAHSAAALFWYIRNSLYFSNGLDELDNVLPLAYEDLVAEPRKTMQGIFRFIECRYVNRTISGIHAKSVGRERSGVCGKVLDICYPLYDKLRKAQAQRWNELGLSG